MSRGRTAVAVVGTSVLAACVFGIAHDLVSTQVCLEYFSVFHPRIIESQHPIALAVTWGVVATWWMGVVLGCGLAAAAVAGPYPLAEVRSIAKSVARLLAVVLFGAVIVWILAYRFCRLTGSFPLLAPEVTDIEVSYRMAASYAAHNFSYFGSAIGAMFIGVRTYQKRQSIGRSRPEMGNPCSAEPKSSARSGPPSTPDPPSDG